MLTISELASHAGVTVRTVRHYHAKGLLPEPERDASGYRRYDAAAVVTLIRIRTLAEAGVPLSRVGELLAAKPAEFASAIGEIDQQLRDEIRRLRYHRTRIAQLAAGDSLALPPEAVAYFDQMRALGFAERLIEVEMDSWILIAARAPNQVPALMAIKRQQLEDGQLRSLYLTLGELVDCTPDDPRLPEAADGLVAFIESAAAAAAVAAAATVEGTHDEVPLSDELIQLLDTAFVEAVPCAPRLLELLEARGWSGWTMIRRA